MHPDLMFAAWAERYLSRLGGAMAGERKRWQRSILERHLVPALGNAPLNELPELARTYTTAALEQGLSRKTINNHLSVVRSVLRYAADTGALPRVPRVVSVEARAPTSVRTLSSEESERLLKAAEGSHRTMILLALRTGLRVGELRNLRFTDLDSATSTLSIANRRVPLSRRTVLALQELPRRAEWMFSTPEGAKLTHGACKRPLARAARRAGLSPLGWDVLRHTFTRELLSRGVPVPVIQALLGLGSPGPVLRCAPNPSDERSRFVWSLRDRAGRHLPPPTTSVGARPGLVFVPDNGGNRPGLGFPHFGVRGVPMIPGVPGAQPTN